METPLDIAETLKDDGITILGEQVQNTNCHPNSHQPTAEKRLFKAIRKKHKIGKPFTEEDRIREISECLNEGADINDIDKSDKIKNTILHIAVQRGYTDTVKFLLEKGADTDTKNTDNETPLDIAEKQNNIEIITLLGGQVQNTNSDKSQIGEKDGKSYEKSLITLLSAKGFEHFRDDNTECNSFGVGREVKFNGQFKFGDVVFMYPGQNNTKNLIIVQSKHKENYCKIKSEILSSPASSKSSNRNKEKFNLELYFISYLKAREFLKNAKSNKLKNGKIKYCVFFTNAVLDIEDLEKTGFRLKKAPADIISLLNALKSENYCRQFEKLSDELQKKLEKHSDLHRLANELTKYIVDEKFKNEIMKMEDVIKHYHAILGMEVITVDHRNPLPIAKSSQKLDEEGENYFKGRFRDDFINNEDEGPKQNLRNAIFEAIRELDKSKKNASPEELKTLLLEAELKLPHSFRKKNKAELKLPHSFRKKNKVDDTALPTDDVTDFLNHLVYIDNQPHAEEYEKYVNNTVKYIALSKSLLKLVFEKIGSFGPDIRNRLEKILGIDEIAHENEKWISEEEIVKIFQEKAQLIGVLCLIAVITILYENDIMKWGLFKLGQIKETLDNFFLDNEKKALCINTPETSLSSIKILQYFSEKEGYRAEDGRISVSLNDLTNKGYQNIVVEAFKLKDINLLTIQCTETNQIQVVEEFYDALYNIIIKDEHEKRIILVIQKDKPNILRDKFVTTGEYSISEIDDEINIKDFEPKTDFDPLKQEVIIFPGQRKKISLSELIGNSNWSTYLDELSKYEDVECIIDASSLVQLLNNDEIIIGSEPPRISSLEGAYAKLFEEINKETFRDKLFDDMSDNLFIISGINGSDKEKIDELIHYLGIEDRRGEIENEVGNSQSGYKIQIEGDQFKDEQFVQLCQTYPDRKMFWIIIKNKNCVKNQNHEKSGKHVENENQLKFMLYQFYNPDFYINRKFINKIFITKQIKRQLINHDLSERFIFSGVTDKEEFTTSFRLYDTEEVQQFRNNCSNGKITVVNNEQEADCYCQSLSKEQGVELVYWLTFEESRLVWRNSHGSFQNLRKYIDKEPGKEFNNKVFITKEVKHQLLNPDLSEVFIFSGVGDIDEFTKSFKFSDNDKEQQLRKNCRIFKIRLLNSEQEGENHFEILSKQQAIKMLHWLTFEKSFLVWHSSYGSLENLREYTDEKERKESLIEEKVLIKEIKDKKAVIIADDPGMGKSTTLTRLYESRNESESILESHWVIRINLRDHLQAIKDIDSENIDVNIVKQFLFKLDLNLNHSLAKNLLRIALNKKENSSMMLSKPLLIAFDGFDELLDEEDRNKIISLLKFLKNESGMKFWITTRLHYKQTLENALSTFAIEFHPIDEEKTQFITKYLKDRMSLILSKGNFEEVFGNSNKSGETTKITKYTNAFLSNMESVFQGSTSNFLGTPLQLYLMLEGSVTYFKNWIENYDYQPLNFDYLGKDILEVYEKFIQRKYEIYFNKTDVKEQLRQRQDKMNFDRYYENLAISTILNSEHKKSFEEFKDIVLSTGIVKSQGSIYEFIHPTFGEYFAAQLFIHWIEKTPNVLQNYIKQEYLLREIFLKPSYKLIRMFMNIKLKEIIEVGKIPEKKLKLYGEIISKLWDQTPKYKRNQEGTILYTAVFEDNEQIVSFIFNCLEKMVNSPKKIVDFLAFKVASEISALYQAAVYSSNETFELMLYKISRILSEKQFYNFLRQERIYIFSIAFFSHEINSRKRYLKLMDVAEDKLSEEKLCQFLGQTDLHRAVIKNYKDKFNSILTRNVDKEYLFRKDNLKKTVLHYAVAGNKYEFTEKILKKAKKISSEEELKSFLFVQDLDADTVFHIAVNNLNFEIIKIILEATKRLHAAIGVCELLRALNDNSLSPENKTAMLKDLLFVF